MKIYLYLLSCCFPCLLSAQEEFIDTRDGHKYAVVNIAGVDWLKENLRYISPNSYCKVIKPKDKVCKEYNYYPKQDLNNVCPDGWRLPQYEDWEKFHNWFYQKQLTKFEAIEIDTIKIDSSKGIIVNVDSEKLNLFSKDNPLNLLRTGWVQGRRRKLSSYSTIWINTSEDNWHLHLGPEGYVRHHHAHHIEDKPRKLRQFVVRCVREKKEE